METKLLNPQKREDLEYAGRLLREGGLVALPTETVYGLAADALNPRAVEKIYAAKGRPSDNPLIVHISEFEEMRPLVREIPEAARKLAEAFWPGPLTMVLPKTSLVPEKTSGGLDTVAIRLPAHPVARAVIRAAGRPLAAPSANRSGRPSPTDPSHVLEDMNGRIEAVVDGGVCAVGVESTVVTLVPEVPVVLRPGGVTVEQLRQVLGRVEVAEAVTQKLEDTAPAASPGMKYKHYAPKTQLVLADISKHDFIRLVNESEGWGALCFEGEEKYLHAPSVSFGREYDSPSQAKRLFSALYELDEKNIPRAYVRRPLKTGVGLAVYNRLIRAAGFQILTGECRVLGLTGPTGSGKSAAAHLLEELGFVSVDCDALTRSGVYDAQCLSELANAFGSDILFPDGSLNRTLLAKRAFSGPQGVEQLNAITFPRILHAVETKISELKQQGAKKILLDAPTLFESGTDRFCVRVIAVDAPPELRLKRIMARDSLPEEAARQRMAAQKPREYYLEKADFILENSGGLASLAEAAKKIAEEVS